MRRYDPKAVLGSTVIILGLLAAFVIGFVMAVDDVFPVPG